MKLFNEWLELRESMNVYIKDYNQSGDIHELDDLTNILQKKVVYPLMEKIPEEQQQIIRKSGSFEVVVPDGVYYSDGTPIVSVYVGGWPQELITKLLNGLKYYMDELKIKYSPFKLERSGMYSRNQAPGGGAPVYRFEVLSLRTTKDAASQLNLTNTNARVIFHDLLGFPEDNEGGFFNISPQDLLIKIENLERDQLDLHARDPYQTQIKGGAKAFHGGLDIEQIKQRLEIIKKIAQYAIKNGYMEIYVT